MAAQKLFSDFPAGVGGVTPMITANITQKSAEDDPNTLAGYRARLAAQRAEEEGAYQSKLGYQRGLQLQWELEDKARAAADERALDKKRRQAFDTIYRPQLRSQIEAANNMLLGRQQPFGTRAGAQPVDRDVTGASGWYGGGLKVGGRVGTDSSGTPVYGGYWASPTQGQVQSAMNTTWNRMSALQQLGQFDPQRMTAFAPTAAQVYGYTGAG